MVKNILVVGQLGYHEDNIVKPIIKGLRKEGCKVSRLGGNWDFFVKENQKELITNYFNSIPKDISKYDHILFVDFWNMIVPMFAYLKSINNSQVKFVSLFHGSVKLKNDVANNIIGSKDYEKYLLSIYDKIIVPKQFLKKLLGNKDNISVCPFPLDFQKQRIRKPEFNKRVIFSHRWEKDKGSNFFLKFAKQNKDIECIVTQDCPRDLLHTGNVRFIGKQSQEQLKELCKDGGYAWSSVDSETWGYTIFDLVSYGLTPLLNNHPAYDHFPDDFKYKNIEDAKEIINEVLVLDNYCWTNILDYHGNGSKQIAKEIINLKE